MELAELQDQKNNTIFIYIKAIISINSSLELCMQQRHKKKKNIYVTEQTNEIM